MELDPYSILRKRWKDIVALGEALTFRAGQVLFYEGHEPYGIFVILSGLVEEVNSGKDCGREFWSSPQGQVLGLSHILNGSPLCCTAVAATDCEVLFIPKTLLEPYFQQGIPGASP